MAAEHRFVLGMGSHMAAIIKGVVKKGVVMDPRSVLDLLVGESAANEVSTVGRVQESGFELGVRPALPFS